MSWLPRRPPEATRAIHPETFIHPVIQDRSGRQFGQAMTLGRDFESVLLIQEKLLTLRIDLRSRSLQIYGKAQGILVQKTIHGLQRYIRNPVVLATGSWIGRQKLR